jgi:hypothetical protein
MQALYGTEAALPYTRNLIATRSVEAPPGKGWVGDGQALYGTEAAFRESYQLSTYVGTLKALGACGAARCAPPGPLGVYAMGLHGPVPLLHPQPAPAAIPPTPTTTITPAGDGPRFRDLGTVLLLPLALFLFGGLSAAFRGWCGEALRTLLPWGGPDLDPQSAGADRIYSLLPLLLLFALTVVPASVWLYGTMVASEESFGYLNGMSIWPAEGLRGVALFIALAGLIAVARQAAGLQHLGMIYRLPITPEAGGVTATLPPPVPTVEGGEAGEAATPGTEQVSAILRMVKEVAGRIFSPWMERIVEVEPEPIVAPAIHEGDLYHTSSIDAWVQQVRAVTARERQGGGATGATARSAPEEGQWRVPVRYVEWLWLNMLALNAPAARRPRQWGMALLLLAPLAALVWIAGDLPHSPGRGALAASVDRGGGVVLALVLVWLVVRVADLTRLVAAFVRSLEEKASAWPHDLVMERYRAYPIRHGAHINAWLDVEFSSILTAHLQALLWYPVAALLVAMPSLHPAFAAWSIPLAYAGPALLIVGYLLYQSARLHGAASGLLQRSQETLERRGSRLPPLAMSVSKVRPAHAAEARRVLEVLAGTRYVAFLPLYAQSWLHAATLLACAGLLLYTR